MPLTVPHKRLCFIPLDARPVCYDQPRRLAAIAGLELDMPSPKLLGKLKQPANFKTMKRWIKNHLFENAPVIVALDTLAYGGLISSRVSEESFEAIENRLDEFFNAVQAPCVYGFSSIMRIPDYNSSEEEPDYWALYGKALHDYSVKMHQNNKAGQALLQTIPADVLKDFEARRRRNLSLNLHHLERLQADQIDYLTFCQDDTGEYGLNVQEAETLSEQLKTLKLTEKSHIQTGADEVAGSLLARWYSEAQGMAPRIFPVYTDQAGRKIQARFDGLPIERLVNQKISDCGAVRVSSEKEADLILLVHTPQSIQGDHCEGISAKNSSEQVDWTLAYLDKAFAKGQCITLADVSHANGSDPKLAEQMVCRFDDLTPLYGYAGWNTPGNTLGTAIAMGMIRWIAEEKGHYHSDAFNQLLMIRLGDDWFYQANVRYTIREETNGSPLGAAEEIRLNLMMANGLELIQNRLGLEDVSVQCRFPCHRSFEIEINLWS